MERHSKRWTGNNGDNSMKWFRIEEGAIIGGSIEKDIPKNEFPAFPTAIQ
jgi:hypothetical protein